MPKIKRMSQNELETVVTGGEPVASSDECSKVDMIKTLNWYSNNREAKHAQKYVADYFKKNKLQIDSDKATKPSITFGWLCRMVMRGFVLSSADKTRFEEMIANHTSKQEVKVVVEEPETNVISIQDRVQKKTFEIAGDLDYAIDELITSKFKTIRSPLAMMQDKVKPAHAKIIIETYKKERKEIQEVLETDDEQLLEGYRLFTKSQLRKLLAFYDQIINDAIQLSDESKQTRKPRKRKVKTPEQLVSKVKILAECKELKLKSEDARKIVGANQLWIFNVKTRKLGVYQADDASGLSVKGSTILNFNQLKSISKTLRKPDEILSEVVKGGKVFLRNVLGNIRAKEKVLTGRLNGDTILVKIIKD